MRAARAHAPGLSGAGEAILVAQHAIDLLRGEAREFLRRGAGAVKAQGRGFEGLGLAEAEAAVRLLGLEHGEHAGDAIARQAEFVLLGLAVLLIIFGPGEHADRQHLAHRRVGELIAQPGREPLRLRDPGDAAARELGQPAAAGDAVLGREGGSALDERHVDGNAAPIDVLECPVLAPFLERQRPRRAIDVAHRLDVLTRVGENWSILRDARRGAAPSTQNSRISFLPSFCLPSPPR